MKIASDEEAGTLVAKLERPARDLVLRCWPAVEAVAALLLEKGESDWIEVRDVLSTFVPPTNSELERNEG
jgi:hypothetical protein